MKPIQEELGGVASQGRSEPDDNEAAGETRDVVSRTPSMRETPPYLDEDVQFIHGVGKDVCDIVSINPQAYAGSLDKKTKLNVFTLKNGTGASLARVTVKGHGVNNIDIETYGEVKYKLSSSQSDKPSKSVSLFFKRQRAFVKFCFPESRGHKSFLQIFGSRKNIKRECGGNPGIAQDLKGIAGCHGFSGSSKDA